MAGSTTWTELLAASCSSVPSGTTTCTVIDPATGEVCGTSATDDVDSLRDRVLDAIGPRHREALDAVRADSWQFELDGSSVSACLCWDFDRSEAAVVVASWPVDRVTHQPFEPVQVAHSTLLHFTYDANLCCTGADSRLTMVGMDPGANIGAHPLLTSHPADFVRAEPLIRAVVRGEAAEAEYGMRSLGPGGLWFNHHVALRPLAASAPTFVAQLRALGAVRAHIDPSLLTERQLQFVGDYFSGLDIAGIARRYDLSMKTVRNRLSDIYGTLGVGSAADMVATFDPPDRLIRHQVGLRPTPLDTED